MIFGIYQKHAKRAIDLNGVAQQMLAADSYAGQTRIYKDGRLYFSYTVPFETTAYRNLKPVTNKDTSVAVVFTGVVYNSDQLRKQLETHRFSTYDRNDSWFILRLYEKFGLNFVERLDGKFAFAIWDKKKNTFVLGRDRLGIEPLYYYSKEGYLVFSSSISSIFKYTKIQKELNLVAVAKFLLFNYNPGSQTFFNSVQRLRAAHLLICGDGYMKTQRYWKLSFNNNVRSSEHQIKQDLLVHLRNAVRKQLDGKSTPGIFLSGGLDSSTVLALATESSNTPLSTFSYRCKATSFDESHYARLMATHTQSIHHEIHYSDRNVLNMPEIVTAMNEPFCDLGINIATYLLGEEARRKVSAVLTGDGGDELFGGHPVYEADKVARFLDPLPSAIKAIFCSLLSFLPDSDKKKNFLVQIKRFTENLQFPKELLSHRWRIYYSPQELMKLLTDSFLKAIDPLDLYADILSFNIEADGPDRLSHSLYSDYQTAMDFYLRRNDLNRLFRLEVCFPLLDQTLVEFCASIPSNMKVNGWFDTKYIFKKSVENLLPEQIVYRRDKLGHSIPMKKWLRESSCVRDFVFDYLSESTVKRRAYFNYQHIHSMIKEHMSRQRNNSHRLWALAVFEMWLREHLDN